MLCGGEECRRGWNVVIVCLAAAEFVRIGTVKKIQEQQESESRKKKISQKDRQDRSISAGVFDNSM
jgi:hypothetical protein